MISSTQAYKEAIVGTVRKVELKAVVDISDPDIEFGEVISDSEAPFSNPEELHDKKMESPPRYATIEPNRWLLDSSFQLFPASYDAPNVGFANNRLSNGETFDNPAWVELQFSHVSILQACAVYFSADPLDGVPVDFVVEVKEGGVVRHSESFTKNKASSVFLDGFTVYNPDAIRVTVTKWSTPWRRLRVVEIIPGIYDEWTGDEIAEFSAEHNGDFSCLTIPYGSVQMKMDNLDRRFEPRNPNGVFKSIEERQAIDVSIGVRLEDGKTEYKRVGMFYQFSDGWKTGDNGITMQWDLVDIIGLLSNREFIPPTPLPTTLSGWLAAFVAQLGENFENRYSVDPAYADKPLTASLEDVQGKKIGDLLRYACMAAGTWPRADAETGKLTAEPLWNEGNKITLDNMSTYPGLAANTSIAAIIFTLADEEKTKYAVSGNSASSEQTVSVENPFIHTQEQALAAARLILAQYGGNAMELTGRGDPASEIGDVDTVWLDESNAGTGRRMSQEFSFSDGVMVNCRSTLLQADGSFLYEERAVITESGTWKAPAGVSSLRIILVGKGADGQGGKDGTWEEDGADGADGTGGKVWAETIGINEEQEFAVVIGEDTTFGEYSSANGQVFPYGYTDIQSGSSYARTGVENPLPGSGDGGKGGKGGANGETHEEDGETVIDRYPGYGQAGAWGAVGCAVIYWDK